MPLHLLPKRETHGPYEFVRRYPRVLLSIPITVRHLCHGGVQSTRGISLDVGEGGLGALVQGSMELGETVALDFRLSEQGFRTVAIVRHTSRVRSGFEFVGLTRQERLQIRGAIGHA